MPRIIGFEMTPDSPPQRPAVAMEPAWVSGLLRCAVVIYEKQATLAVEILGAHDGRRLLKHPCATRGEAATIANHLYTVYARP